MLLSESPKRLWETQTLKCLLHKKLIYSEIVIAIYMQITCDYKQDKNLLIRKQTINRDFLLIYPAMFISYNSMIDTMQKYYAEQITLNSK